MRDIKFRCWHGEKIGMMSPTFNGNINEIFAEGNCVYMQYTGLKDKNGVEIYEGDLLKTSYGKKRVYWNENFACWSFTEFGDSLFLVNDECEVIGNVYEVIY